MLHPLTTSLKKILNTRNQHSTCPFCYQTTTTHLPLCRNCFEDLPWDTRETSSNTSKEQTISAFHYHPPISNTLLNAKFGKQLSQLQWLADMTALGLTPKITEIPQAILPVPLHTQRLRKRGFNQALELARPLAKQLNIPIINHSVIRSRHTQAQSGLPARERDSNVQNAFQLNPHARFEVQRQALNHIALFDDVITTGATLNEIKQLLHNAGIQRVDLWSCARTMQ